MQHLTRHKHTNEQSGALCVLRYTSRKNRCTVGVRSRPDPHSWQDGRTAEELARRKNTGNNNNINQGNTLSLITGRYRLRCSTEWKWNDDGGGLNWTPSNMEIWSRVWAVLCFAGSELFLLVCMVCVIWWKQNQSLVGCYTLNMYTIWSDAFILAELEDRLLPPTTSFTYFKNLRTYCSSVTDLLRAVIFLCWMWTQMNMVVRVMRDGKGRAMKNAYNVTCVRHK